jgi:hypothetical protein
MKYGLQKKKHKETGEASLDQWLQKTDIGALHNKVRFQKASFPNLQPTNWDKLYAEFQKSKPINIRHFSQSIF